MPISFPCSGGNNCSRVFVSSGTMGKYSKKGNFRININWGLQ